MTQTGNIQQLFKVAFAGLGISFLGSLPLGTMNIAATHISIQQGTGAGLVYATGSMLVEVIVVRIALVAMDWLAKP
jgi:threonine/homoserine/homoserine lactone efflux protein